ncbi:MAG: cation:proton antiporter [Elusimicrobia bacterium]|nr:cation:proton antiporter [Elusimicrobiota bacterium]
MEMHIAIFSVGILVFLAHFFTKFFEKTRIPDVLMLVMIGLIIGPGLNLVSSKSFGQVGHIFSVIALIIILFESGLGLTFSNLKESAFRGMKLATINFVATLIVITALSMWIYKMQLIEGLILSSILAATSAAVVIPMIDKLKIAQSTKTALIIESTFSDVLCIIMTLGFMQMLKYNEMRITMMIGGLISSFLLAALIGAIAAIFWSNLLSKVRRLDNNIFLTPAFVFVIYSLSEMLGYSGPISALAFGIMLGNISVLHQIPVFDNFPILKPIQLSYIEKSFFGEAVFLLKTFFFVYIGLSIQMTNFTVVLAGFIFSVVLYFIRVPVVKLATERMVTQFDAIISSVMVPKGLVSAVLVAVVVQAKISNATIMEELTYSIILFTIIFTTILVFTVEKTKVKDFYASFFLDHAVEAPQEEGNGTNNHKSEETPPPPTQII